MSITAKIFTLTRNNFEYYYFQYWSLSYNIYNATAEEVKPKPILTISELKMEFIDNFENLGYQFVDK